jgi:hypothetical protein
MNGRIVDEMARITVEELVEERFKEAFEDITYEVEPTPEMVDA